MMTKNKKRARLALTELEAEMEVLSVQDSNACKAGAVFFSLSGAFLGRYGESDEIRVISEDNFKAMLNDSSLLGYQIDTMGICATSAAENTQSRIFNHYASSMGLPTAQWWRNAPAEAGFANSQFFFKPGSFILENESSIISTLQHEKHHFDTGCIGVTGVSGANCEVDAILYQVSTPEYNNTNYNYRVNTAEYLWQKINESTGGTKGNVSINSLEEAYKICKVGNY